MQTTVNGEVSHWWRDLGRTAQRPPLTGDTDADVCIVGAGFTGLWTAYYLRRADPTVRVVVLEERFAGFGASGRNGGWLTNTVTGEPGQYVASHGLEAATRQQRALTEAVHEVVRVTGAEGIDADLHLGGELVVARSQPQLARMRSALDESARWPDAGWVAQTAEQARERINVTDLLGGMWHPHCARLHPAKLVAGLAAAAERAGAEVREGTRAEEIAPGAVRTPYGTVRAEHVIRATEGFTARIPGERRTWLPMNSSLVVTEPLPAHVWDEIGWAGREALGDGAHAYMYAQRTADDRIAFGGRGKPYRFASALDPDGATPPETVAALKALMERFFPALGDVAIAHAWSGVLGVPRDWSATVSYDRLTGMGYAGGYVGTGVTATNLAGRTLADLVLGRDTDLTTLPWVNHRARRWEPEPLRWLGVQAMYAAYRAADRAEDAGRRTTSPLARVADLVSGR